MKSSSTYSIIITYSIFLAEYKLISACYKLLPPLPLFPSSFRVGFFFYFNPFTLKSTDIFNLRCRVLYQTGVNVVTLFTLTYLLNNLCSYLSYAGLQSFHLTSIFPLGLVNVCELTCFFGNLSSYHLGSIG